MEPHKKKKNFSNPQIRVIHLFQVQNTRKKCNNVKVWPVECERTYEIILSESAGSFKIMLKLYFVGKKLNFTNATSVKVCSLYMLQK